MPSEAFIRSLLLPELRLIKINFNTAARTTSVFVEKEPREEYCPKCASRSETTYDHRWVRAKDEPVRGSQIRLHVLKRRLWCKPCRKPFTEPIPGIRRGFRHTERYGRALLRSCERYSDLKQVRRDYRCSAGFLYKTLYRHLELERRKRLNPWPAVIGLDEHFFRRNRGLQARQFVSMVVDMRNRRLMEVVEGKTGSELEAALSHIPGRENVKLVALDMSDTYKSFAKRFFPNARLVADKFHVLRLLGPHLARRRKELALGHYDSLKLRQLLLRSRHKLSFWQRKTLERVLAAFPALAELYRAKEALHALYRTRGYRRAKQAFINLVDHLGASPLPELRTLRRTLLKWRSEILAYFYTRLTNGRTEGFNLKAKLVKRRAFGYRSFKNYRLRLLNACAH